MSGFRESGDPGIGLAGSGEQSRGAGPPHPRSWGRPVGEAGGGGGTVGVDTRVPKVPKGGYFPPRPAWRRSAGRRGGGWGPERRGRSGAGREAGTSPARAETRPAAPAELHFPSLPGVLFLP